MKNYLLSLLFVFSSFALAETEINVPTTCLTKDELAKLLAEFEEKPISSGETFRLDKDKLVPGMMLLFVNITTKTFTIVEVSKTNFCIVSAGKNFTIIREEKKI